MSAVQRLRKLRNMSGPELQARVSAAAYRGYERWTIRANTGRSRDRSRSLPSVELAALRRTRFLPSVADLAATRHALVSQFPREVNDSIERADRLLRGECTVFGQSRNLSETVNWHADPVSGGPWPLIYHRDVPIGDRSRAPGDAKDVWELNRQQFLVDLGKASLVTGRDEYITTIHRLVGSWIDANPYGLGVNWSGPLEVAYRALSWMWAYCLAADRLTLDAAHSKWLSGFDDHGQFLFRHLERYESPFNHLIGEASVLFMLGTLFPEFAEAARWRQRGREVLETRLGEQFYADGGSVEQATVYHHATVAFYLAAALVARQNRDDLSPAVWSAIERGLDYSMHLTQPDGRLPAIGDNDDARPIAFDVSDNWDFRHLLAAGAVVFQRTDLKAVAGRLPEDAFWLVGPQGLAAFDDLDNLPAEPVSSVLPDSGYVILRGGRGDYVCFDCGEQAGGLRSDDLPSAAHGHADALSVIAFLNGRSILADAGFFTYDGDRDWERHFRETAAHNTVRVDGRDQARHLNKMAWTHVPRVRFEGFHHGTAGSSAIASHDGYARTPNGVRHRRAVWLRAGGYLVILDELTGHGTHDAEVIFQLGDTLTPRLQRARLVTDEGFAIQWCASVAIHPSLYRGEDRPDGGWIAPRLGVRVPAGRLVLSASFSGALRVLTTITNAQMWTAEIGDPHFPDAALVQRLSSKGAVDRVFAPSESAVSPTHVTDGLVAIWREQDSRLVEAAQIGGSFIRPDAPGAPSC